MLLDKLLMGRRRHLIAPEAMTALNDAVAEVRTFKPRSLMIRAGDVLDVSMYVIDGLACRYMDDRIGHRQLVALQISGDFTDLHAFPLQRLDHDVASLTETSVAIVPHVALRRLVAEHPSLAQQLWFSTLLDAAMHREWIFLLGRLGVEGRIAHLFLEMSERMRFIGLSDGRRFRLPLLQGDIAEACGCTTIHVNRVLRQLRERGLVTFRKGEVTIHDPAALAQLGQFDPRYLYGDDGAFAHVGDHADPVAQRADRPAAPGSAPEAAASTARDGATSNAQDGAPVGMERAVG